jgi:hypothetical protein
MIRTALHVAGCVLICAALAFSADPPQTRSSSVQPGPQLVKKLGSVTWDLKTHKLVWTVQSGNLVNGKFVAVSEQEYSVSPDEAVMSVSEEQRGFAEEEANSLQHLLDVLTVYCAESVVWWDQGEGTPVDGAPAPTKPTEPHEKSPGSRPVKVKDKSPVKTVPVIYRVP